MILIRESLDCGLKFEYACAPHSYVQVLQELVTSLPSPLLPFEYYPNVSIFNIYICMICILTHL